MRRIVIVKEGQWGTVTREEYEQFIELLKRSLEEIKTKNYTTGQEEKAAEVVVIDTAQEVKNLLKKNKWAVDILMFVSRGMESVAEKIAAEYPRIRVVVFTGFIPDGKVIWFTKTWITQATLRSLLLR